MSSNSKIGVYNVLSKYSVLVKRVPVTLPTRGSVLVKRVPDKPPSHQDDR